MMKRLGAGLDTKQLEVLVSLLMLALGVLRDVLGAGVGGRVRRGGLGGYVLWGARMSFGG